ncbi:hypothetical protein [Nocardia iowensis]|uniref:Transposase n=1 Tax=Nocardia iowensis TaxID=204891 RepID=A0ABX8RUY8_NOCIO|nr:hypothetical protein [Nocardia iowensis]QXN93457.1 hypothetical protein KV110_10435 [Nocardia iowensis]
METGSIAARAWNGVWLGLVEFTAATGNGRRPISMICRAVWAHESEFSMRRELDRMLDIPKWPSHAKGPESVCSQGISGFDLVI